jgi:predicted RNA binding protein YcfA (HicA-like mRNA interferase family)
MKIPRGVSGAHLAATLCRRWRYAEVHQVGSHIILETSEPVHQRISIPDHDPLRLGTLSSILRRAWPSTRVCPVTRLSQVYRASKAEMRHSLCSFKKQARDFLGRPAVTLI